MSAWALIASKVAAVFAVMIVGVVARRLGWLTAEADASLLRLVVRVLMPAFFFSTLVGDPRFAHVADTLGPAAVGLICTAGGFFIAAMIAKTFARPLGMPLASQRRAFAIGTGLNNYGYLPLPLAAALFNSSVVSTTAVHNVGVEIALWTVGVLVMTGGLERGWWKRLLNPPVIAIAAAVTLNATGLSGPIATYVPFVLDATKLLGVAAVPLGLLLSGAILCDHLGTTRPTQGTAALAVSIALRQGIFPAVILLAARWLPISIELKQTMLIQAAMPAAIFTVVVVRHYGQDNATAVRIVVTTSVIGLVTIPLWIAFGHAFLGV